MAPDLGSWHRVVLHRDGHVQFELSLYSAPFTWVGKTLWLRATDMTVALHEDYRHLCTHLRAQRPGQRVTVRDHLPPDARAFFERDRQWCVRQWCDRQWCVRQATAVGPRCAELVGLLLGDRVAERLRAAQGILGCAKTYGSARLEAACERALGHDSPHYRTVKTILATGADQPPLTHPTVRHNTLNANPMNPIPELAPQLKLLRLSGILDSLDERNRQAVSGQLAYTDFLAMLIGDEVARRESKKFDMRLRRAQFRTTKTLEQFDFARLPKLNRALVHDLASGRYLHEKAPVLLVGPSGIGKSHLAQALGHCAVRQGVDVVFTGCAALTQSLNAARAIGAYDRKLAALARVPLLIIDDFGLKPLRAPADEDLHDLIAERYERAATLVTSNLDFDEWTDAFAVNRLLASATIDRLRHKAYCLELDGQSYRDPQLPPASKKTAQKPPVNAAK